uniref:Tim10-like domain-containing protein n=2 Tax=Timema TaxID=61471 RepID=A0A7R9EF18_9NEOP|nr:unnamed protein product [Timema cristinae]CAD7431433.1 unnamed protein product [Timema monikensis]
MSTFSADDIPLGGSSSKEGEELQEFLMLEKQKAQFNAQASITIHEFNDFCWEKCMEKPGSKLDSRTETCMNNCVDRFIDVSLLITNRFAQLLQKSAIPFLPPGIKDTCEDSISDNTTPWFDTSQPMFVTRYKRCESMGKDHKRDQERDERSRIQQVCEGEEKNGGRIEGDEAFY